MKTKQNVVKHIEPNSQQLLDIAAIVKGLIEKKDAGAYMRAGMNLHGKLQLAEHYGVIRDGTLRDGTITRRGNEWYTRCLKQLPPRSNVYWNGCGGVGKPLLP